MNYLYNGVELPDINAIWNKTTYPYAYIYYRNDNNPSVYVMFFQQPEHVYIDGITVYVGEKATVCRYEFSDGEWSFAWEKYWKDGVSCGNKMFLLWSNIDILNTDGSVYLTASDPVPVPTYDPTALLQGYLVGCRIRAMRGKKPIEPDTPIEPEYDVIFENGVLYIKKAPAVMVGSTLSFASTDINGGELNG